MASTSLREDYWQTFQLDTEDVEFIYQHLLEVETPLTSEELLPVLVEERIRREVEALEKQRVAGGQIYLPKEKFDIGQKLVFPALGWQKGEVLGARPGKNPDVAAFDVISVLMENGEEHEFASGFEEHLLNNPAEVIYEDEIMNAAYVLEVYHDELLKSLDVDLEQNADFVKIAGRWFPLALLMDINVGHLNLAEAVLDMNGGGPMTTNSILEQVEIETSENDKLVEFSFDFALEQDERFDEVGPAGKILWYLQRLEPEEVRETPIFLKYSPIEYDRSLLTEDMLALERLLDDEQSIHLPAPEGKAVPDEVEVRLIYPHLQAGTLPLSARVRPIFPTAYEAPRVRFILRDGENGDEFPGWVVLKERYVFGLKDWFLERGLGPGSIVRVQAGEKLGEVIVSAGARRSSRDWMRTVLVGSDGGIVFAMLRQIVEAEYDERMAIAVPDMENLEKIWHRPAKQQPSLERAVVDMVRELTKLNPQGHVHTSELYAAVNLIKRCPPGPIMALLASRPWFVHVGDLHFRFDDSEQG
ncbi:MAG: hypothetical protein ACK2UW_18360 [Anaerolineales bacterium]